MSNKFPIQCLEKTDEEVRAFYRGVVATLEILAWSDDDGSSQVGNHDSKIRWAYAVLEAKNAKNRALKRLENIETN
jgi:hypothetical protein